MVTHRQAGVSQPPWAPFPETCPDCPPMCQRQHRGAGQLGSSSPKTPHRPAHTCCLAWPWPLPEGAAIEMSRDRVHTVLLTHRP